MIQHRLELLMPHTNSDEHSRIFGPEGPLGTFANKVRIAQAFGLFDRAMRKRIDIIRAMRNAAAHCVDPIGFDEEPFRSAVVQLAGPSTRERVGKLSDTEMRYFFELTCMGISALINSGEERESEEERINFVLTGDQPPSWHDKAGG